MMTPCVDNNAEPFTQAAGHHHPRGLRHKSFVLALPDTLGEGWDVVPSQIPVGYATVDILEEATSIVVTVSDASGRIESVLNIMDVAVRHDQLSKSVEI